MRLTLTVCRWSMRFAVKRLWRTRGFVKVIPEPNQWYLEGKTVIDPIKTPDLTTGLYIPPGSHKEFIPHELRYSKRLNNAEKENYHEDYIYEFDYNTRLMEGLKQACILTKTKPIYGLPQRILDSVGSVEISNQDELMQRYIMQANVWDPTKDKLPRRIDKKLPGWRFKAEHGIPQRRIRSILVQNIVRLCRTLGGQYPNLLDSRAIIQDPYVSTSYTLYGNKPILIRGIQDWLMTSTQPIDPFATSDEVNETKQHELPDMFPVMPTITLKNQHVFVDGENITGYNEGLRFSNPHTLFSTTVQNRRLQDHQAKMLMYCFAHCLATAKAKYGPDISELPEPITIQYVSTDSVKCNFACFQLNTLDFSSPTGLKNQVWFDNVGNHAMYNKILPKRAMLRNTQYEDYDPEVFRKILAFYVSGADLNPVRRQMKSVV